MTTRDFSPKWLTFYTNELKVSGFKKKVPFEAVKSFLLKTLDTFQFGHDFNSWVKILYTNITSCTINNGYASNWFELHRGVRQGCPLSGLLFVLAVEILSIAIRASRDIKGIQIANREIKLSQYADDTTVFCRDIFSLGKLLDLLSTFGDCSGLKLNVAKSEAMWLGKSANRKDMPFDIKWPKRPIYALGTAFSYNCNLCESENFTSKINKLQKLFNIWSQRDLSLYGRILITKTLGLSKLIYSSACVQTPTQVSEIVNKLVVNFIWNGKKPKIKRDTLIGPKDKGGLELPDYEIVTKSLQCAWVKRMKEGIRKQWMEIPSFYLENVGGPFIFDCDYDLRLLNLSDMPAFYIDILKAWTEVQGLCKADFHQNNFRSSILWNNKNITIEGKSVYWKEWHTAGIDRLEDLLDENNSFLGYYQFCRKTGRKPPFTKFFGLIAAIPSKWKQTLRFGINLNSQETNKPDESFLHQGTCKSFRNLLTQNKFRNPLASSRLCRLGVEYDNLKAIYLLPFNVTKETKLSMFQYKIIHNILPYGNRLYMMKILNSPLCNYCNLLETLSHMLVECNTVHDFWVKAISWWNSQSGNSYAVNALSILYGYYPAERKTRLFNYYILLGKRYIFVQRLELKTLSLSQFLDFVKNKIIVQRAISQSKGQMNKFYSVWKPFLSLLENCN